MSRNVGRCCLIIEAMPLQDGQYELLFTNALLKIMPFYPKQCKEKRIVQTDV